jgi:hypothetical protein
VRVGGRLGIGDWRLEIGDWRLEIGDYGFTAKARRSGRDAEFLGEAKRGVAEVAEEDADGELGIVFSPPRGQER